MYVPAVSAVTACNNTTYFHVLHARLGHRSLSKMAHLPSSCNKHSVTDLNCESCVFI